MAIYSYVHVLIKPVVFRCKSANIKIVTLHHVGAAPTPNEHDLQARTVNRLISWLSSHELRAGQREVEVTIDK